MKTHDKVILTIVFTVAGILGALIAVPNFRASSALFRAERNNNYLISISKALEVYYTENKTYPLPDINREGKTIVPHILTTPVRYLDVIPKDENSKNGKGDFEYAVVSTEGWILMGEGNKYFKPDMDTQPWKSFSMEKAISDKTLGYSLKSSVITYSMGYREPSKLWIRENSQGIEQSFYYPNTTDYTLTK